MSDDPRRNERCPHGVRWPHECGDCLHAEPQKPSAGPELADVARYADAVKRWNMAEPLRWITECEVCKTRYENGCGSTECCGSVQYIVWEGNPHNNDLGLASSYGCVRMSPQDVADLCAKITNGTEICIK